MKTKNFYSFVFLFSYGFLFTTSFLSFSTDDSIFYDIYQISKNVILPISWGILLFQSRLFLKKWIIIHVFFLSIFTYFSYLSKDSSFLIAYIFILLSKFLDIRKCFRFLYFIALICITFIILYFLYKYYILGEAEYLYDHINERARYTFEMFHPNKFPMRFFIFLSLFFMVKNKVTFINVLFLLSLDIFIYLFSYSRSSFLLSTLLIVVMYISQFTTIFRDKFIQRCMELSMFLFPMLSLFAMINYNKFEILEYVNKVLSERIRFSYEAYDLFGLAIFPRDMRVLIEEYNIIIDNLYVALSLSNLSLLILFSIVSYFFIKMLFREFLYKEAIIFFFMMLYSITESHMINIGYNVTLLLISLIFYPNKIPFYKRR